MRVVDPDSLEDVPAGEQGELWFRSKQLMKGYHNKPEATAEAITDDGWFRTGDIGRVDADGYIFVEDRLKDMIISGGENIYSHRGRAGAGRASRRRRGRRHRRARRQVGRGRESRCLNLKGRRPRRTSSRSAGSGWPRYKCPKTVDIVDELPRNPTGKILKKDLRKPYWEGAGRASV